MTLAEQAGQRWEAPTTELRGLCLVSPLTPSLSFWNLTGVAKTEMCSSAGRVAGRGLVRGPGGVCSRKGDAEHAAFGRDTGHTGRSGRHSFTGGVCVCACIRSHWDQDALISEAQALFSDQTGDSVVGQAG